MAATKTPGVPLPGELEPIVWHGERRGPVTPDEVLGTTRRLARLVASRGRPDLRAAAPLAELPPADSQRQMTAHRLLPLDLAYARTRAELEHRSLTAAIDEMIHAFGQAPPGTVAVWVYPDDTPHVPNGQ